MNADPEDQATIRSDCDFTWVVVVSTLHKYRLVLGSQVVVAAATQAGSPPHGRTPPRSAVVSASRVARPTPSPPRSCARPSSSLVMAVVPASSPSTALARLLLDGEMARVCLRDALNRYDIVWYGCRRAIVATIILPWHPLHEHGNVGRALALLPITGSVSGVDASISYISPVREGGVETGADKIRSDSADGAEPVAIARVDTYANIVCFTTPSRDVCCCPSGRLLLFRGMGAYLASGRLAVRENYCRAGFPGVPHIRPC